MKTIAEQIAAFEAKRVASTARMNEIMSKSADEGRTLDETETQEYDTLSAEVKAVDVHISRLKEHEKAMVARAAPAVDTPATGAAVAGRIMAGPKPDGRSVRPRDDRVRQQCQVIRSRYDR